MSSGQRRSHHWSWQVAATSAAIASPSSNIGSTGYGGIGYALAKTFAGHKMKLALIDNSQEHLSKAVSEMQSGSSNDDVLSVKADVSSFEDMQKAAKEVNDKFGKVNVLCLNAGTGAKGANTFDSDMASWQKVLGVNLLGVIYGSNAFVGDMVKSKEDGLVIVTGSKQGITCPPASGAAYNVSKAGVKTFTEQLAHELREATDERITAHLLVPGWTFTKQVVDYGLPRIAKGEFYIICPDDDVTSEMDKARMEWSANDVVQNRPALSRWSKSHKDEFEAFMKQKLGN
ncbi:hypothetical protein EMMF5_001867 [Cystobasidiomycetes sp. EMM_F5]